MYTTTLNDDNKKDRTVTGTPDATRRNPIAVAAQQRYMGTNAAGPHESNKYSRKTKHKTDIY